MDPAGSYDNGSLQVMNQVYPFLMNFVPGSGELKPDIAQRCEFSAPTIYTCVLKPNLKFANGHDADVVRRQVLHSTASERSTTPTDRSRCWPTWTASQRRIR